MNTNKIKYIIFIYMIYMGMFWSCFQYKINEIFSYWDEILALLFIPLLLINIINSKDCRNIILWMLIALFLFCGIIGNIINGYTKITIAIQDAFLNIKFFMICYTSMYIFKGWDLKKYKNRISIHLSLLTIVLLLTIIMDKICKFFPVYEVRFGIESEQIFYKHPTFCASALFYLLMLRWLIIGNKRFLNRILDVGIIMGIVMTLRFKAIATIILIIAYMISEKNKKIKGIIISVGTICVLIVTHNQIYNYFFSDYAMQYPRGALFAVSMHILKDFFPFGTGFATFGSFLSGEFYSPIYAMYKIDKLPGITIDECNAITDQYWPMIAGQTGISGLLIMIIIWIIIYNKIKLNRRKDNRLYIVGMSCFIYILISSTSESAICNPVCIPMAIVIGLVFSQGKIKNGDKNEI